MHPYRTPPIADVESEPTEPAEESVLIGALILLGAVRVVVGLATDQPMDAEGTIALAMLLAGVAWGAQRVARVWRLRHRT